MNKFNLFLISALLTLIAFGSYQSFSGNVVANVERQRVYVERTVDGDTLITKGGLSNRLVNINTPEHNEPGYELAQDYLKRYESSFIEIEDLGADKYNRRLIRAYSTNYINLDIVEMGLGKKFLVQEKELMQFSKAEREAIENQRGIWGKSEFYGCFHATIDQNSETVKLRNQCNNIRMNNWVLTDESRKQFVFPDITLGRVTIHSGSGAYNRTDLYWNSDINVWNNDRDTLYLLDEKGRIVLYEDYGY